MNKGHMFCSSRPFFFILSHVLFNCSVVIIYLQLMKGNDVALNVTKNADYSSKLSKQMLFLEGFGVHLSFANIHKSFVS